MICGKARGVKAQVTLLLQICSAFYLAMNMNGTLIYSALSTPIFCFMFWGNICERLEKHSSLWKWFAATIQDHILISF